MARQIPAQAKENAISIAADIVAAYVSKNALATADVPALIRQVHAAVLHLGTAVPEASPLVPAISIKKSVTPDFIICLEDGRKFKSLKRHLRTAFNMSPGEYRAKWGLAHDYPMVAANYAATRSELAKSLGLGQLRQQAKQAATAKKPIAPARKGAAKKAPATGKSGPRPANAVTKKAAKRR